MRLKLCFIFVFFSLIIVGQNFCVPEGRSYQQNEAIFFEFDQGRKVAKWVGYTLKASDVQGESLNQEEFYQDPNVVGCPSPGDYYKSGYSYGQFRASGDSRSSDTIMKRVNYFSNIAPMDASLKQGVWRILNNLVRGWAVTFDSVVVISGPIYTREKPRLVGKVKINVPDFFYKAVLVYNGLDMGAIGFVVPNLPNPEKLSKYSMPIDSLEYKTGLNFFDDLPDYIEFYMEETVDPNVWKDLSYSYQLKAATPEKKRCVAALQSGERCTLNTTCVTQQCWKHGCDVKADVVDD